jgi:integrase
LAVEQQLQRGQLAPLKTRASRRTVPVDDFLLAELSEHLQRWPAGPAGFIVTNRSGRPASRGSFGHCWRQAVERAGLPAGTRFHDLRHFYVATLIAGNVHPKTIQARCGHATIAETMDTYGHLFPDSVDHGRGVVERAFASVGWGTDGAHEGTKRS